MNDWAQRKPLRLRGYDYGRTGYYFVTVCTAVRGENILAEIFPGDAPVGAIINRPIINRPIVNRLIVNPPFINPPPPKGALTPVGKITEQAISEIPSHYPNIKVDTYVVMPDHVHMILEIHATGDGRLIAAPTGMDLSKVIQQFKRVVSKTAGFSIWQRSYYDHIVRNREDLENIRQYIQTNPQKWILSKE